MKRYTLLMMVVLLAVCGLNAVAQDAAKPADAKPADAKPAAAAPAAAAPAAAAPAPEAAPADAGQGAGFANDADRYSYAMGMRMGGSLKSSGLEINPEVFSQAMKEVYADGTLKLSQEQCMNALKEMNEKAMEKNACKTFFEENTKKDGVKTLPSGLQYQVVTEGTGEMPKAEDKVQVNYKGTLLVNGTEFDSSYKRGKPAELEANRVIKGWTEALQLMKVGSKWTLWIPPALGYGERGAGQVIPPNSALCFEVELLQIMPKTEAPKAGSVTIDPSKSQ